ncbi:NXPE family member 3-like isoform 2-T2 [Pholidichthys leucotaenia]
MKHGLFRRLKHCTCTNCIFIFLSFLVLLSMLFRMDWVNVTWFEVENKQTFTTIMSTVSADPYMKHDFCYFHPWSPKEAFEQALLLDSIAWPETPNLLSSLPQITGLIQSSDPAHSTFTILPGRKGWEWHIGDELEVVIKINDFLGYPKEFGGDLLFARLHNPFLGAGVAGQVVDHLNGTYSAVFSLLWEGNAYVEVILVHSSEAISVLHRLTMEQHDRVVFQSFFRSGLVHEITTCNVCLRATEQPVCNYTDIHTGEPWFCYKPKTLSCNDRLFHRKGGYKHKIKINEEKLFQEGVNLKVYLSASGPSSISVLPKMTGQPLIKTNIVTSRPSGYYYLGAWQALGGTKVNQFNTPSAISQCLKRKKLHLYGDSTVRQWFEYLQEVLPGRRKAAAPQRTSPLWKVLKSFAFLGRLGLQSGDKPPAAGRCVCERPKPTCFWCAGGNRRNPGVNPRNTGRTCKLHTAHCWSGAGIEPTIS